MEDTVELARELARIARDNDLAEIEYRSESQKIRLVREEPMPAAMLGAPAFFAPPPLLGAAPAAPAAPAAAPAPPKPAEVPSIKAILAGVFYRAPRPGAPPFVEVGQQVSVGQTLCILEAMKQMNEIRADINCRVLRLLVENAQVVEVGQALFEIEPLG